jgi:catechol 2,3-dioxygenase-like lactoylglutathione lyase family enzyme
MSNQPRIRRFLESALYVADLDRSYAFYDRVFGFRPIVKMRDRLYALRVGEDQVLLLFKHGCCNEPLEVPGGRIPPHGGSGVLHFALAIDKTEVEAWRDRLRELDVPVSSEVEFPGGARSIYFRDPDDHVVELATPEIWDIYAERLD